MTKTKSPKGMVTALEMTEFVATACEMGRSVLVRFETQSDWHNVGMWAREHGWFIAGGTHDGNWIILARWGDERCSGE